MQPIISICIPTYRKTVKDALESIISQFNGTIEKKIEIIVGDDASPDTSIPIFMKELSQKYDNIKYIRYDQNRGLANNLTYVTTFATGAYLWLLADDDILTNFALQYTLDLIEKTEFDLMVCNAQFGPKINKNIPGTINTFKTFHGMYDLVDYLYQHKSSYQDLVVFFQFYSILVVKHSYFKESFSQFDEDFIYDNIFPQDIIVYSHIKDKVVVLPDTTFVFGRTMNESYKGNKKFITDFEKCMGIIEDKNGLQKFKKWKIVKRRVISGWRNVILLGMLLRFLCIDYKKNVFWGKVYARYKRHLQNRLA